MAVSVQLHEWYPCGERGLQKESCSWSVHEGAGGHGIDQLLVEGNTITWYQGLHPQARTVKKVFHVDGEVLHAFWCFFKDMPADNGKGKDSGRCLCVCEQSLLSLFMLSGASYYVPLPFSMRHVWPAPGGILVERQVEGELGHVPCEDGLAVFFMLQHPLNDLTPVTFRSRSAESLSSSITVGYFISTRVHVVAVCQDSTPPLVITYDESSHRHTVWAAKPARNEDIPSPVQNPPSVSTPHPMSSSAPARYHHHTPSTPIPFSLQLNTTPGGSQPGSAHVPAIHTSGRRESLLLKPPAVARIQYDSPYGVHGGGGRRRSTGFKAAVEPASSGVDIGSGRSPFISRLRTPLSGQQPPRIRKARSLSPPPHYARFSPFCFTHISRSISSIYPDETLREPLEPLLPQTCFHQLWTEPAGLLLTHKAASVFLTEDYRSTHFLAMMVPDTAELWLVEYTRETIDDISFRPAKKVKKLGGVVQAVPVIGEQLMLVLTQQGELNLYSGNFKVTSLKLVLHDEQKNISHPDQMSTHINDEHGVITRLREPVGSLFTVEYSTGRVFQFSVPRFTRHPAVSQCLAALQSSLPSDVMEVFMASYYCRFTPSPSLLASLLLSSSAESIDTWTQFHNWLLQCLGVHPDSTPRVAKSDGDDNSDLWVEADLLIHDVPMEVAVSALACLQGSHPCQTSQDPLCCAGIVDLCDYSIGVASALHMVYEDMKLDIHQHHFLPQFAAMLFQLAQHLRWPLYADHYVRDCPSLLSGTAYQPGEVEGGRSPPCVFTWIMDMIRGKQIKSFPIAVDVCHKIKQVLKIYSFLTEQWRDGAADECANNSMDIDGGASVCCSVAEKVASYLVQEGVTVNDMESFPVGVALPIWCTLLKCQASPPLSWPAEIYNLIGRHDIARTLNQTCRPHPTLHSSEGTSEDDDGMNFDTEILALRFPRDLRVREVRRMLQSSRPVKIALKQKPEVSDHQFVEEQEAHLMMLSQRTMALPVGRGMFTLATTRPLPTVPLTVPQLNLSGKVPPRNTTVGLDRMEKPRNMTAWPEFHNGVATGLRVAPDIPELDSSWIAFNQPSRAEDSNEHAGFLLGLGLHGHLSNLSNFSAYEYLLQKHELTVVGLLIGMGASQCGKMNLSTSSMLAIFFPPLLPPDSADMEVSMLMQTAAVAGLGLLYMESSNRFLVETLLKEIGHSPGPDLEFAENRESYALTAGLSLGMIALGAGDNSVGLSDLNLEDKLCVYINGGAKSFITTGTKKGLSQLILEGERVNTNITAAGATVALGLVYLKTNNRQIAGRLSIPSTQYELDLVRSDLLLLRVWCRGLILWDSVEPTEEWINYQIPEIVQKHAFQANHKDMTIDYQTMSQAYMNIVTGGCLAIACRYAGTCNQQAYSCLLQIIRGILSRTLHTSSEQAGKYCMESSLCAVLLSLAVVMSGSGDLEVLRVIRRIRSQGVGQAALSYGGHMATHMALGFLFLGGGRCNLSRSNTAIAALLCSLYPHFPSSSTDNRYHLQALRHIYVLASELRVLVAIDSDTDSMTAVPIRVQCSQGVGYEESLHLTTPGLLPEWQTIKQIKVLNQRYWPMKLDVTQTAVREVLMKTGVVYVKRKTGYLSYEDDPQGQRSLLSLQSLSPTHYLISGVKGKMDLPSDSVREQTHSVVAECYKYTCKHNQHYGALLLDCIAKERLQLLPLFMHLEQVTSSTPSVLEAWQVKILEAFCATGKQDSCGPVVARAMLKLQCWLGEQWRSDNTNLCNALVGYLTGRCGPLSRSTALLLAVVLLLYDVPSPRSLPIQPQDLTTVLLQGQLPPATTARILQLLY